VLSFYKNAYLKRSQKGATLRRRLFTGHLSRKKMPSCASKLHPFATFSNTHFCKTTAHLNFLSKFVYLFRLPDFVVNVHMSVLTWYLYPTTGHFFPAQMSCEKAQMGRAAYICLYCLYLLRNIHNARKKIMLSMNIYNARTIF
jgi:hypothetical protein